jgi:hypothetical protein
LPLDSSSPADTLTVALLDSVKPAHAPIPTTDSERLLFRQLYETLVRLDCQGETHPALAASWHGDSGGRIWTFTLGNSARLPDGSPMTAPDVASSWLARRDVVKQLGIDSVEALDDRRLRVSLGAEESGPSLFAEPGLAVLSGLASDPGRARGIVIPPRGGLPLLDFEYAPNGDPRDAIDRGVDLVITRDPALADYVAGRPEFSTFPLPWSRTYALLQPAAAGPIAILGVDSVRRSLAGDVAQAEARAAEPPFWWDGQCHQVELSSVVPPAISPRIVYRRDDKVARGLAERIVALTSGTIQLRTVGLDPAEFAAALRNQHDRGYILDLPRQAPAPCHELAALPEGASIEALIDTRARAIVRRGSPPLSVDWDGTVRPVATEDSSRSGR